MYIDYLHYKEMGGKAEESCFTRLEFLARKKLDHWTQSRIDPENITPEIRMCMTLIIDALNDSETGESSVASVSNDGLSVSFADAKTSAQIMDDVYQQVVEILPVELVTLCV